MDMSNVFNSASWRDIVTVLIESKVSEYMLRKPLRKYV